MRLFEDRRDAARELADALAHLAGEDVVVLALPNGGVPVAEVICERLQVPMDVLLLEKLSAPRMPDHIVGAVDEHGRISLIDAVARWHRITPEKMLPAARQAFKNMQRRRVRFRTVVPDIDVRGRTVIIVDDGVTDGASMLAGIASVRDRGASRVIAAAPAGMQKATWQLHDTADMVVIPHVPAEFRGIERFFREFPTISDEMALEILRKHVVSNDEQLRSVQTTAMPLVVDGENLLYTELELPDSEHPVPVVIYAHGHESDGQSPRSVPISRRLGRRGIAGARPDFRGCGRSSGNNAGCTVSTMVADLHVVFENLRCDDRFDITRVAVCGAGLGAHAALVFAAEEPTVAALVLRGPVLDEPALPGSVEIPTLLLHAEADQSLRPHVDRINGLLRGPHRVVEIAGSNRLYNDALAWEQMVSASVDWLSEYLAHGGGVSRSAGGAGFVDAAG